MNDTLIQLRTDLRYRLNDADSGNFTDAELNQAINYAIRETELVTKCHIYTLEVSSSGQVEQINEVPVTGGTGYTIGDILTVASGTGVTAEVVQTSTGIISTVDMTSPAEAGTGYAVGDVLTVVDTYGRSATVTVATISGGGTTGPVTGVTLTTPGTGYTIGKKTTTGGTTGASGCKVNITAVTTGVSRVKLLTRGTGALTGTKTISSVAPAGGTGCTVHIDSIRSALASGTHTYDHSPIFEPLEVSLHWNTADIQLDPKSLSEMKAQADWNVTAAGQPTSYIRISGSQIRLYPTPNQNASATYYLRVYGNAVSAGLVSDYDRPTSIPEGYRIPCILDHAEAGARKMRLTTIPNVSLYESLMARWNMWCEKIIESSKGKGR